VVDVVERDADGDLFVRLSKAAGDSPLSRLAPGAAEASAGAPGLGDRLLVRFETLESGDREARLIKRLGQSAHRVLGVVRKSKREVRVEPVDRRSRESLLLAEFEARDLRDGDLVLAQVGGAADRPYGPKRGKVLEVLSDSNPRQRHPDGLLGRGRSRGGIGRAAHAEGPHGPAPPGAHHHRSRRCKGSRRRCLCRTG